MFAFAFPDTNLKNKSDIHQILMKMGKIRKSEFDTRMYHPLSNFYEKNCEEFRSEFGLFIWKWFFLLHTSLYVCFLIALKVVKRYWFDVYVYMIWWTCSRWIACVIIHFRGEKTVTTTCTYIEFLVCIIFILYTHAYTCTAGIIERIILIGKMLENKLNTNILYLPS